MNKFFALSLFVAFALVAPAIKADEEVEPQVSDGQEMKPLDDLSAVLDGFCSSTTDFIFEDLRRRGLNTVPEPLRTFLNNTAASHRNAREELIQFFRNPGEGLKRFAEQQKSLGQKLLQAPSELFNQAKNATEQAGKQLENLIKNRETNVEKAKEYLAGELDYFAQRGIFELLIIPYKVFYLAIHFPEVLDRENCREIARYNYKIIRRFEKLVSDDPRVSGIDVSSVPCPLLERIQAIQKVCFQSYTFYE